MSTANPGGRRLSNDQRKLTVNGAKTVIKHFMVVRHSGSRKKGTSMKMRIISTGEGFFGLPIL